VDQEDAARKGTRLARAGWATLASVESEAPILIAYDGSEPARAAVRAAGKLFAPARALVLTVWEPDLAQAMLIPDPTGMGGTMMPYDPALARDAERASERHALAIAQEGAELAQAAGLQAQALTTEDSLAPEDAIVAAAAEHDAGAIVIGSRGLRGLKSKLLGSTSAHVLRHALRPVVVVRNPEDHGAQA
jgi:nucleotide-binding universal stress UspA family protein